MDTKIAAAAFAALSQETRLDVLRLLVREGPDGLPAGEIATRLGVRQNTMSTNLGVLLNAGLIRNERAGRSIRYSIDVSGVRALVGFLVEDCCQGRPEMCMPFVAARRDARGSAQTIESAKEQVNEARDASEGAR